MGSTTGRGKGNVRFRKMPIFHQDEAARLAGKRSENSVGVRVGCIPKSGDLRQLDSTACSGSWRDHQSSFTCHVGSGGGRAASLTDASGHAITRPVRGACSLTWRQMP